MKGPDVPAFEERNGVMHVNGGVMEGGGQILRNCVALASVMRKPLAVHHIRANRPRGGGLRAQHLNGILLCGDLYDAKMTGMDVGSCDITYHPRGMKPGVSHATADTKTAGSICLLCQVSLPCCVLGASPTVTLTLRGGTNATQAPPVDYLLHVFLPTVERFGVHCQGKIKRRGFFPKGGGELQLMCTRVDQHLTAVELEEQGRIQHVAVHGFYTPDRADGAARLDRTAVEKQLKDAFGAQVEVEWLLEEVRGSRDRAAGVTLAARSSTGMHFGFSELAEFKRADSLDQLVPAAVAGLVRNVGSDGFVCVDEHMQDQLILFMALARGTSSIRCGPITLHTRTAIFFCQRITGAEFIVERMDAGKPQLIDVQADVDYEHAFPASRFRIQAKGVGLKVPPQP